MIDCTEFATKYSEIQAKFSEILDVHRRINLDKQFKLKIQNIKLQGIRMIQMRNYETKYGKYKENIQAEYSSINSSSNNKLTGILKSIS